MSPEFPLSAEMGGNVFTEGRVSQFAHKLKIGLTCIIYHLHLIVITYFMYVVGYHS